MSTWIGNKLKLTVYGQSHSQSIGMIFHGVKSGEFIDYDEINRILEQRKASSGAFSTPRKEPDEPKYICGIDGDRANGKSIEAIIENKNTKSGDYESTKNLMRPSHADYAARVKFGDKFDYRGGGQFSGRMTAPICVAGGIASGILKQRGVKILAYISEIGENFYGSYDDQNFTVPKTHDAFSLLNSEKKDQLNAQFAELRAKGDSIGGVIECVIEGLPAGVGDALFDGLESKIAALCYGVPAVKCVEFGLGKNIAKLNGSSANDAFYVENGKIQTKTNHNGGINGGISNGMLITFRVAIKPTPSISLPQQTVDIEKMENAVIEIKGRHDVCIVPRAVPVIESVAAIAILDSLYE